MLLVGGGRVLVPVSVNKVPNGVRSLSVVTGLVPEARVSVPDKLDLVPGELQRVPEEMVLVPEGTRLVPKEMLPVPGKMPFAPAYWQNLHATLV